MKHLGDITQIHGWEIEPVDVITGGSPCQDLSIAGKRAGLAGKRSGLFVEQIRVIKEMREADAKRGRTDNAIRPRYMVWENVKGAFSSNKGQDFAAVLEETIRIVEPNAPAVPVPAGGWPRSGCLYDEMGRWSIAWRLHDAQFWGVPQRRERIALVADFGGLSAPEISFERKGVRWGSAEGAEAGEDTTRAAGTGIEAADLRGTAETSGGARNGAAARPFEVLPGEQAISFQERAGKAGGGKGILIQHERVGALSTVNNQAVLCVEETLVFDARGNGDGVTAPTLTGDHENRITDYTTIVVEDESVEMPVLCFQNTGQGWWNEGDVAATIRTPCGGDATKATLIVTPEIAAVDCRNGTENPNINGTLQARKDGGFTLNANIVVRVRKTVRRLTPLECDRLQGYPDNWTDIGDWTDAKSRKQKTSDSNRYKADGNSIALPFWFWLLRRISAQYERPATLGSLFDGIGGFPLCWERCNGKGTALWASEIEEFAIAVTKVHFPEEA